MTYKEKMFNPTLLRVLGVIASLCLIVSGLLVFIVLGGLDPIRWVLAIYFIIFGFLFTLAEFNVKWIITRITFMGNRFGRAMAYLFGGVMVMSLNELFGWFLGGFIVFVAIVNLIGYCCLRDIAGDGKPKDANGNPISSDGTNVPRAGGSSIAGTKSASTSV
eukprot:EC692953.1.p1 GENE.EC692953.1~~EC692953.1.p1  ORF type:complete len:162 (+),score=48.19 EC692953.1:113-598(+)